MASDDQGLQRFLQEARTSTMIKHKNLAMLYDFATLEDGSYYMVWEFIDGTNIQKWIGQNGPMPPRLAVEISIQALNGLEHLHSMGLIHRDISPENIMLSQDHHGKLLVKVIDFGIAKQLAEGEGGQGLTQTGMFLGKLKYASPEQAGFLKEGEHLDPRSDLYSFGIVMYEMLAGRAPFQATNPHGYILKHATERPQPISQINPKVKVPPTLEAEVFKALEKDRDNRHLSAADFANVLESIKNDIPGDDRYGIGDWRGTISGAQTLVDKTSSGKTSTDGKPAATRGGAGDRMIVETAARSSVSQNEATIIERTRPADDDATLVERVASSDADATRIETKQGEWRVPSAEPTLIERKRGAVRAEPSKRTGAIIGIAAALLLVIAGGIWFATRKKAVATPVTGTVAQTATTAPATQITGTTEVVSATPIAGGTSELQLVASPYGQVEKIVNTDTHTPITLSADDSSTPLLLRQLQPGNYELTVSGPDGVQKKVLDVKLEPGVRTPELVTFQSPDLDSLSEEVLAP